MDATSRGPVLSPARPSAPAHAAALRRGFLGEDNDWESASSHLHGAARLGLSLAGLGLRPAGSCPGKGKERGCAQGHVRGALPAACPAGKTAAASEPLARAASPPVLWAAHPQPLLLLSCGFVVCFSAYKEE